MPRERTATGEILNDTWETPAEFIAALNRMIGYPLELDVCANAANAKCEYYIDRETNALGPISWARLVENAGVKITTLRRAAFCNPGYSNILPWCQRAYWEAQHNSWATYILAHDNFCGPWFRHAANYSRRIYLLYPRIQFVPPPGVKESTNSRCSILIHYSPVIYPENRIIYSDWRKW